MNTGNRKRVAIFCFNRSGIFQYSTQLAAALAESGQWEVLFITSRENPAIMLPSHPAIEVVKLNAPHQAFAFLAASLNLWQHSTKIWQHLQEFKPDVIHIADIYPWYIFWGRKFKHHPLIVTIHDTHPHQGERLAFIVKIMNWYLLRKARWIVVHGEKLKEELTMRQIRKPISVIPLGNFNFYQQWQTGAQPKPNTLLFFGRLLPYKGIDILLEAFVLLQKSISSLHLTIAGEGDASMYSRKLDPTIKEHVVFDNRYIPEEEVAALFEKHHIIVLPYLEATQSGVAPIAFAFKRPIIATNVGALPEIIQHKVNGLLVPPGNPVALSAAIKQLLENPFLANQLAEAGWKTANNDLSWDTIADLYSTCYQEAIKLVSRSA